LNTFALDYCDLKLKSILQFFAALWDRSSNVAKFQQFPDIAWLYCCEWHFQKLFFNHTDRSYKLCYFFGAFKMIWPMEPNPGFCPQIWVFNALLDFYSEDLFFFKI